MAHFLIRICPTNTSTKLSKESSFTFNSLFKRSRSERVHNWVVPIKGLSNYSTGLTSSSEEIGLLDNNGVAKLEVFQREDEDLASDFGWRVRRLVNNGEETLNAARIQAQAFYEPSPIFNDFFFQLFQAEVLAGLLYKLRNSPPKRYACLVAEPATSDISNSNQEQLVGVVDITALRDQTVLQTLPKDAHEYLYISGIAVSENFRRKKIGTVLLRACDTISVLWGFNYLVLRAYEDDLGARELYSNAGYSVVSGDPLWLTTWLGRKRRIVMVKHSHPPP